MKGIKREFSVAKTPQQNGVAERKNRTLIEAARTMLADSLLPTTFLAEAINTACYVHNRILVTKPHNKTPYELLLGRPPSISFMRPFGCPVTILNTLDPLGKFDGKDDEGEWSKWLFDIDSLTKSINYEPNTVGNQTNSDAGIETNVNAGQAGQEKAFDHEYILLPLMLSNSPLSSSTQSIDNKDANEESDKEDNQHVQDFKAELDNLLVQQKEGYANNTNRDSTASPSVSTVGLSINTASRNFNTSSLNINTTSPIPNDSSMQSLENTGIFDDAYDDRELGAEADLNNLETTMNTLVDLPKGKRAIGTKWVYRNKKDERGIIVRNKSAFLYGTVEEEVYVCQPPGFEDPQFLDKVYKKRSMIGSLMYLTASRPDITFAVCACAMFQVTPKVLHLRTMKWIFRYLKGQPKLGLWYPRDSPFDLEAFSDNDYAGASLDRKSTTGGYQFLGKRLISWQCKKQTIVANSTTEAEYVAAANCCEQDRQSSMAGFGEMRQLEVLRLIGYN
ncbi:putative ribonuclease H-like domain-containing protein [Tanacetum coccineum]